MSEFSVSSRYAKALLTLSNEKGLFDEIAVDIEFIFNTLGGSKELRSVLKSPIVNEEQKISLLDSIFAKHIRKDSLNFIKFIVKKGRENLLYSISKRYLEMRDDQKGVAGAEVLSSVELTDNQKESIKKKLEEITKKNVRLNFSINKSIIGGFVVRLKDTVIDASISNQLRILRENLLTDSRLN